MADRQPQVDGKPFQLGLMRILLGVSVACGISAVSPFIGMVVAAYTPCLIGLLMLRHGAKNGQEKAVGWGVVLMCIGFILGSLVLTAIGNLDALEMGSSYNVGVRRFYTRNTAKGERIGAMDAVISAVVGPSVGMHPD